MSTKPEQTRRTKHCSRRHIRDAKRELRRLRRRLEKFMLDDKNNRPQVAQPTVESESLWRRNEFDRGYKAGYQGSAYSPTSLSYIEGYESGELAAMRAGKRRI